MARQPTPDVFKDALAVSKVIQDDVRLIMGDGGATPVRRDGIQDVPVGMIDDNPFQPRLEYSGIEELAADIAANGLLQVPKGRRTSNGRVQLQYGHRRLRAVIQLGWVTMPVEVQTTLVDDEMAVRAWAENHNRQDFTAMDQARYFRKLLDAGWTQKQIAERLGLSAPAVSNTLKLLRLPEDLQGAVANGNLSARQADALLSVVELPEQIKSRAENFWDKSMTPQGIIKEALAGASSDRIRDRTRDMLRQFGKEVHETPWYRHEFREDTWQATNCDQCPIAVKRDIGVYCPDRKCFEGKRKRWYQLQLEPASTAAGIPIADEPVYNYSDHESFMYEKRGEAILSAQPPCKNLRLVTAGGSDLQRDLARLPDFSGVFVVCQKAGNNQCACLNQMKRKEQSTNPSKTRPAALAKEIIAPAADILAAELATIPRGLLRIMMNEVRETYLDHERKEGWLEPREGMPDEELPRKMAENILKWHCQDWKSPATNRAYAAALLHFAGLRAPWLPPDASQLHDRLQAVQTFLDDYLDERDGLPTPTAIQQQMDELNVIYDAAQQLDENDRTKLTQIYSRLWAQAIGVKARVEESYAKHPV